MKLTRKQGILAILAMPAGIVMAQQKKSETETAATSLIVQNFKKSQHMAVTLVDEEANDYGIDSIAVTYAGQTKKLSAKDIWEAIQ